MIFKAMKPLITLQLLCLLVFSSLFAEGKDNCNYSTEGTDFWFGLMQNRSNFTDHYLEITVTSRIGASFILTYGPTEIPLGNFTVNANDSKTVPINYSLLESMGSETVENKGIHLVSTNPVNVYALNYRTQSSDVAVIYPTESLGNEYFAMCYSIKTTSTAETNSEFLIVATQDNTKVKIVPSKNTDQGRNANVPFTITLNKGQSYQVQSANNYFNGQGDLTGSFVSSDRPVAFFSGSKATPVPIAGNSYDHLYEQIPPTSTWGRLFFVVPLKYRKSDTYRILAAENSTSVRIEGLNMDLVLNRGEFYEFELSASQACRIISTRKILLAQYCRSQGMDGSSGVGDPFMIIISPASQKINDVTFVAYESAKIKDVFAINIAALTSETGNILLDEKPVASYFQPFPKGDYSYAQIPIAKGTHRLRNTNPKEGFLAFIYGFGNAGVTESYGYGVGFNLDIQLDLGGTFVTTDTLVLCQGTEVKLEAGDYFERYRWSTKDTTSNIMASKQGWYSVKAVTGRGCEKSDSIYIKINAPKMVLGKDTSSCGPGKILLKATNGFESYKWQDGKTTQTYLVQKSGDYSVTGTNIFGCQASDTIHVDVFDVPDVKITGDTLHCGVFAAELKVNVMNADPSVWNYPGASKWTSSSTDLVFENSKPDGVTIKAKKPGKYRIDYVLTTKNGCQDTDSFEVGFYDIPQSIFKVYSPESTDKCSSYERIVEYTGTVSPTAKFNWDFGGLILLGHPSQNIFQISIGANKPNRTIRLSVEDHGCTSTTTTQEIGVNPNFKFWASQVHGCDFLCVHFKSEVSIMDSVSYEWKFGDGAVSALPNPIHCYRDTGKYDVSLRITNLIDGCQNGAVESEMIKIYPTPKAVITADATTCYGDTAQFEYLNKKANSHANWYTKGNKLVSSENTKATYQLTSEISEVGFQVEENGCKCDTLKVNVKRKPHFDFTAGETEVCQPVPVTLKSLPGDPNLEYFWSVDSLSKVKNEMLTHLFRKEGNYSVTLEAYSRLTGCSASKTRQAYIHVYPLPVPGFKPNYPVATLEHPEITFSNQTEGAESYLWNFGDGTTSEDQNPKHKYADIGEYRVLLQAKSDFGCIDTISSKIKIIPFSFFVPNAFRPDSEIPENRIFLPIREGIDPEKYQFEIFNRIGSRVFETIKPEIGWDGGMPNHSKAESGIYVWIVKYSDIQGYEHLQKGTVMLVW